ncbi:MAG: hypothetical protein Q9207_006845 [Kuettlingeria erythrocarpa]
MNARNVFKKVSEKKVCQKGMIGLRSMVKLVWKPFKVQFGDLQEELSSSMDKVFTESSTIEFYKEQVKSDDVGLAYFYCDYKELRKQQPSKLLCTLLSQLASQRKSVFQRLQTFVQDRCKENPASVPTHDELRGNFPSFLEGAFKQVILVVDAIDESTQRNCMIGDLKNFHRICPFIKVLISSREELDIVHAFKAFPQVKINQSDVVDNIESFVSAEVAARIQEKDLAIRRKELQQTICGKLVKRSEGMSQWYSENLLKRCSTLVTVTDDGHVSLAHYTVKGFLTSDTARKELETIYIGGEEVEVELAQTCLTYLCYNDFIAGSLANEDALSEMLEKYKFLDYAAMAWGTYAHLFKGREDDLVGLTTKLLKSPSEGRGSYEFWLQVYESSKAIRNAHMVESLLEDEDGEDEDISAWAEIDRNPIKEAVTQEHVDVVKILLEHYGIKDEERLAQYLYTGSFKGHDEIVRYLLDNGVDIDSVGAKQGTALQVAASQGHKDVIQLLLARKASTKVVSAKFGTPLSAAAEKGHERCFQMILNAGASINGQNDTIIQILLNKGANINLTGGRHVCALMAAAALGKLALVRKLIDAGARENDENDKGADALHSACCAGHLDVVNLLLDNGADVNAKGGKHRNALNAASSEGYIAIVDILLAAGADPAAFDPNYGNVVQAAARAGHEDIVRKLSAYGCDVNAAGGTRGTALVGAASARQARVVELLFELGVPEGKNQDTANALVVAVAKEHEDVVKVLVERVLVLTVGTLQTFEWLPLQLAASRNKDEMLSTLLRLGADPNAIGGFLGSVLMGASDSVKIDCQILEALIVAGADVNKMVPSSTRSKYPSNWYGESTALSAAASNKQTDAVRLLLNHGADANLQCSNYRTALHRASGEGATEIVELLLAHGADVNLNAEPCDDKDDKGIITSLQGAAAFADEATVRLLVANGANLVVERDDSDFKSALHAAAFHGSNDNAIELGSNVNLRGGRLGTCL